MPNGQAFVPNGQAGLTRVGVDWAAVAVVRTEIAAGRTEVTATREGVGAARPEPIAAARSVRADRAEVGAGGLALLSGWAIGAAPASRVGVDLALLHAGRVNHHAVVSEVAAGRQDAAAFRAHHLVERFDFTASGTFGEVKPCFA